MKTPTILRHHSARLFLVALIGISFVSLDGALTSATAADALTATDGTQRKSMLGSLFKRRDRADRVPMTAMQQVERSILGLPLGIVRGVVKGVTRAAGRSVTDHIQHN